MLLIRPDWVQGGSFWGAIILEYIVNSSYISILWLLKQITVGKVSNFGYNALKKFVTKLSYASFL